MAVTLDRKGEIQVIGYFGGVIFETSSQKICTFHSLTRSISGKYSDHERYQKKAEREFEGPENQTVSFKMKFIAGYGVSPRKMVQKVEDYCENGMVCSFVIGGHKIGDGRWTIDDIDEDYREIWNHGELVSVEITVKATEYH